jgi:hypothetical protein
MPFLHGGDIVAKTANCRQPWQPLSSCVLQDTVRKSFDAFGGIARVPVELGEQAPVVAATIPEGLEEMLIVDGLGLPVKLRPVGYD